MKITKFQHACFMVEKEGAAIVVDPGSFSRDFIRPRHLTAIIVTHDHPDHFDEALITALLKENPKATLIAHESIVGKFTNFSTTAATTTAPYTVGPFQLQFFGGTHAAIAESVATPPNLGVLIDERLYYPGDSFTIPENVTVQELALPVSAPWLKISESMDFLRAIRPVFAFPTHDGILSPDGKGIVDALLGGIASGQTTTYKRLDGAAVTL